LPLAGVEVVDQALAAAPVVVRLSTQVNSWEKIAAIFTAVGGIGAMLGAGAAWRAALASGRAASDARDALATSLKPHVHLAFQQYGGKDAPVEVRAVVVGPLSAGGLAGVAPATDVRLEFNLASGGHGSASIAVLEPGGSIWAPEPPYLGLVVGHPGADWPPEGGDRVTATVTYSGVRVAATYRLSQSCDLWPSREAGVVSFRDLSEQSETRISP
jgi:hypothetical protein